MLSQLLLGAGATPATPNLPAAANLLMTNNTAGTGNCEMRFNITSKTANFISSSALGTTQNFTVTYFGALDTVNAADYEVSATITLGPTGGSNLALAGGSAALNTWHTLSTSPIYKFTCSGRRSGFVQLTITMRSKSNNAITNSRVYVVEQQSDAVTPSISGANSMSLSVFSAETFTMGFYVDAGSAANQFMMRSYRNGTLIEALYGSFSTGAVNESEYVVSFVNLTSSTPMPGNYGAFGGPGGANASSLRANSANATSGAYYAGTGATGSGSGFITFRVAHITDQAAYADYSLTFNKAT